MAYNKNVQVTKDLTKYGTEVVLTGDWDLARNFLGRMDKLIAQGALAGQISAGEKIRAEVRKNIRENGSSLGWPPLSLLYAEKKTGMGFDPNRLLYATGTYYRSIELSIKPPRVSVRVKPRASHPTSKLTVSQIATILEYGSSARNIPARPLWGPSFKRIGGAQRVRNIIKWHIANKLRSAMRK